MEREREKEKLRREQQQLQMQKEADNLREKAERDRLDQMKAEVDTRDMKNRLDRNDWMLEREKDDYKEKKRREELNFEDERAYKKLKVTKRYEVEDSEEHWRRERSLRADDYQRGMHKAALMDIYRKGRVADEDSSYILRSLFNNSSSLEKRDDKNAKDGTEANADDDDEESEENVLDLNNLS